MEYLMKFIIVATMLIVVLLQTTGDFAIHEGRKVAWHRWKGLWLFILGLSPLVLWLMQETPPNLWDYVVSILFPYLVTRLFFFNIFMNEYLDQPIDYIGDTNTLGKLYKKIFPRQQHQGLLWVKFLIYVLYNVSWIVEWWPGHYFLHL